MEFLFLSRPHIVWARTIRVPSHPWLKCEPPITTIGDIENWSLLSLFLKMFMIALFIIPRYFNELIRFLYCIYTTGILMGSVSSTVYDNFFVYSNMVILKTFNKSCFLKAKKLISRLNSNSFLTICQNSVSIYNFFISWGFPDSPQDKGSANDFFLWIFYK